MIVCPQCRKEVQGKDHLMLFRVFSQINCPNCGYYGLPLDIGPVKKKGKKPKTRNKGRKK